MMKLAMSPAAAALLRALLARAGVERDRILLTRSARSTEIRLRLVASATSSTCESPARRRRTSPTA